MSAIFKQSLKTKETKKAFYFVSLDNDQTPSCIRLKKEELSGSLNTSLSQKIKETKKKKE